MELRDIHRRLMLETLARMRVIESYQPKGFVFSHKLADHEWQLAQGPRWLPSEWFPDDRSPAAVKCWQRAVYQLLDAGLLTGGANSGERLTNIRLTDRGRKLAAQLESESTRCRRLK